MSVIEVPRIKGGKVPLDNFWDNEQKPKDIVPKPTTFSK